MYEKKFSKLKLTYLLRVSFEGRKIPVSVKINLYTVPFQGEIPEEREKADISKLPPVLQSCNVNELLNAQRWAQSLRMFESQIVLHNEGKVIEFPRESESKAG